jgi:general secretion pathway protein D
MVTIVLGLSACNSSKSVLSSDTFLASLDLNARRPNERSDQSSYLSVDGSTGRSAGLSRARIESITPRADGAEVGGSEEGYQLNFEQADIKDVVRAILNDALGLNYTMSADVSGQITISSASPMSRTELLSILEATLAGQGFAMTKTGNGYRIAPSSTGAGAVDVGGALAQPGYGISVVPLRHVSAATMSRLLSGFLADEDGLRVDAASNAILLRGPGAKRQEAVQTVLTFDADWMRGQSVSLFEVRRARPETVVAELSQIFDAGENGASAGVIQFKPINRLRAILAISKNPALIKRAEAFVRRLDGESESAAENVFVYQARYRDAKELARIVGTMFMAQGDARSQNSSATSSPSSGIPVMPMDDQGTGRQPVFGSGEGQAANGRGTGLSGATFAAAFDPKGAKQVPESTPSASAPDVIDLTQQIPGNSATRVTVSADPSNNSVVVYTNGETYKKIHAALRRLDSTPLQVAVNVTIAEVQLNDQLRYGVQYFVGSDRVGLGRDKGSFSLFSQAAGVLQKQLPGLNLLIGSDTRPEVIISALNNITNVQVLSSPSLVMVENQTASLQVGDEVPVTTRQAQSIDLPNAPIVNQVEFRETGIILRVTPRIGQNDAVTMQIEQEISSVVGGSETLTPTISKRKVASNISVVSGQTVLLAGLISEKREKRRNGIPGLIELPGLGDLFSTTNNGSGRTEIVVFIRPVVVRSGEDAQTVAEEFRSRLRLLGSQSSPSSNRTFKR